MSRHLTTRRFRRASLAAALALMAGAAEAQGPRDTAVVPGPQYEANGLKETLLGDDYRPLWTTPVRVETLDLARFAGGLTPLERGGGLQTRSVRFRGADGKEYAFRSVNKWPSLPAEPALRGTLIGHMVQDQVHSLHPAGALAIPPLAEAIGLPHVAPRLFVMPDDPRLGEFRAEFAGMLGQVEERPEDPEDGGGGFPGFGRIIGTDRLLERLEESAEDRVDARTYLKARLLDLVLNDWDRHADQWRWGEVERGDTRLWVPIPRDRDYVFVDYDGALMVVARSFVPNAVRFSPRIDNVPGLTLNARALDRRFLTELERPVWDSLAAFVRGRLTDPLIDTALLRIPPELRTYNGRIAAYLKSRRDSLDGAVDAFYAQLASEVDLRATDERDHVVVDRSGEEVVEVRMYEMNDEGQASSTPYFRRTFRGEETSEIRIYLHGGDDRLVVRGDVEKSMMVRVVGGGGDDLMADSSAVRDDPTRAAFYDGRGDNRFVRGLRTAVETDEYEPPEAVPGLSGESYRDWGAASGVAPVIGYTGMDGPIVGAGPTYTRYGFWKNPYSYRLAAQGMVGLGSGDLAVNVQGDVRNTASRGGYSFLLSASQLEALRFYGLGNETVADESSRFYDVEHDRFLGWARIDFGLPAPGRLSVGPVLKYTRFDLRPGTPFARETPHGESYGQAGVLGELELDYRDVIAFPRNGTRLQAGGSAYPALWDAVGAFGEAHAVASGYWTPAPGGPTMALRAGGQRVWGDFPLHEAAFLGGSRTLRGYSFQRFAGEGAVFGNAELRQPLGRVNLLLVRSVLGVHALADAGRVFLDGEGSNTWHTALGGGVWTRTTVRNTTVATSLTYASGEDGGRLYLKFGAPF